MLPFNEQLKEYLKQDLDNLNQLDQVLSLEKQQLVARDHQALESSARLKDELIKQIQARAKQKAALLAKSGLNIKPGEVTQALEKFGDTELSKLWQDSVEKLQHCKDRNAVNGKIVSLALSRTQRLMGIIRGQSAAPSLYGQQGTTHKVSGSHMLGKA